MKEKGFTLIELIVVIAIIGLLAISTFNFDFNKKTDTEKQERFTQKIVSIFHSTLLGTSSGKGIKSGTEIINPSSTHIRFSTGSIEIYYFSGTSIIGTGEVLNSPFFEDTAFLLDSFYGKMKNSLTGSITSLPMDIVFDNNNNIYFTGSDLNLSSYIAVGLNVQYHTTKKTIEFDRRFGKISILP